LGARLARYTGNTTYADWAEKTWDWEIAVGYIDDEYNIFDGAHVEHNCTDINKAQFSYNNAVYLLGAAYMYNYVSFALPLASSPFTNLSLTDQR
jgi:mannan endo-1,6-alpha-mannosidase